MANICKAQESLKESCHFDNLKNIAMATAGMYTKEQKAGLKHIPSNIIHSCQKENPSVHCWMNG